ncbi:hypothetical protein GQX73_g863 [Xylaria multiplex]|uniref:LYC1 C-terminal domain-containing protein n=1 Tax=Xylaria multiplex TaxID=323545 RepID=A0A7C8IUL9_9PEZI|nr:hypothetical protein GQX73_g863 [Xylaria multiplex]
MGLGIEFPSSESPDLCLSQPTPEECTQISSNTAASWKDSLTIPLYLAESQYLATVPLAKDEGMTTWVLVDKNLLPGQRKVLCSCESFRKRALASDEEGNVTEGLVHGIASVFCPSEFRGRGYGTRHMKEVAKVLRGWQSEYGQSVGSVLYSDIGKEYYSRLGWLPNPRNGHFVFPPVKMEKPVLARLVPESELEALCIRDEAMVYRAMATPSKTRKRVVILPDLDHMLWHIRKEDFATEYIFGKRPQAKGAIAGSPGKQVWAIWVHRYYGHPNHPDEKDENGGNILYILRLVVEGDDTANKPHEDQFLPQTDAHREQAAALEAVLQAAQAEAAEWRLDYVNLWEPSPLVQSLIGQSGLDASWVERQENSIASALWFEEGGDAVEEAPSWVNNEHYAWC